MNARDLVNLGLALAAAAGVVVVGALVSRGVSSPSAASTPVAAPTSTVGVGDATAAGTTLLEAATLDPATLPVRPVDQALFVAELTGPDGIPVSLVAMDAATGDWVVPDLPWTGSQPPPQLSPDGRTIVRTLSGARVTTTIELVTLGTGAARHVTAPLPPDCELDAVAWAPDGRHLGTVSACWQDLRDDLDVGDTLVQELDLTTGATHLVERVTDAFPLETYPSYSPDGRLFSYGIGRPHEDDDEGRESIRVTRVDGSAAHEWELLHAVYGDPWQDATTLVAWDTGRAVGPESLLVISGETGAREPYVHDRFLDTDGFVAGRLLVDGSGGSEEPLTCPVATCTVDRATSTYTPWLTLPDESRVGLVSPARGLVVGRG